MMGVFGTISLAIGGIFMSDRWLSADEIASYLGVTKDTVYTWVTSKGMPGHKVGRFWKFKREEVDAWVRDGGAASSSDELGEKERKHG
jgi:excisionase family DNA binding protein